MLVLCMIENIELKTLYDLMSLDQYRSFTLATDMRHISQSSLTRRIQTLESHIGFQLVDRTVSPLVFTPQGQQFLRQTRQFLENFEISTQRIQHGDTKKTKVCVAAAHSLARFIAPLLTSSDYLFCIENIDVNDTVMRLKNGTSDFILSFYNPDLMNEQFLSHHLFSAQLFLVSKQHQLNQKKLPFLSYTADSYMGKQVNQFLHHYPLQQLHTICTSSSMSDFLKELTLKGYGVSWLPDYSIQKELKEHTLYRLGSHNLAIPIEVYMCRSNIRLMPPLEQLWQDIKQQFETVHTM